AHQPGPAIHPPPNHRNQRTRPRKPPPRGTWVGESGGLSAGAGVAAGGVGRRGGASSAPWFSEPLVPTFSVGASVKTAFCTQSPLTMVMVCVSTAGGSGSFFVS